MIKTKTVEITEAMCDFCGQAINPSEVNNIPRKDNEYEKTTIIVVTEIGDKKTNRGTASGVMCPKCRKTLADWIKNNDVIKRTQS